MEQLGASVKQAFDNAGKGGDFRAFNRGVKDANDLLVKLNEEIKKVKTSTPEDGRAIAALVRVVKGYEDNLRRVITTNNNVKKSTKELGQTIGESIGKGTVSASKHVDNLQAKLKELSGSSKRAFSIGASFDPKEFEKIEKEIKKRMASIQGVLSKVQHGTATKNPTQQKELAKAYTDLEKLAKDAARRRADAEIAELKRTEKARAAAAAQATQTAKQQAADQARIAKQQADAARDAAKAAADAAKAQAKQAKQAQKQANKDAADAAKAESDAVLETKRREAAEKRRIDTEYARFAIAEYKRLAEQARQISEGNRGGMTAKQLTELRNAMQAYSQYLPKNESGALRLGLSQPVQSRLENTALLTALNAKIKERKAWEQLSLPEKIGAKLGYPKGPSLDPRESFKGGAAKFAGVASMMGASLYGLGATAIPALVGKTAIDQAVEADKQRTALAGVINEYTKFYDMQGKSVSSAENFNRALQNSQKLYEEIGKVSAKSIVPQKELFELYTANAAPMMRNVGLNSQQALQVTSQLAALAKVFNLTESQLGMGIRGITSTTGRLGPTNRLVSLLGITKNERDEAIKGGPDAFMTMFQSKMVGMQPALDKAGDMMLNRITIFENKLAELARKFGETFIPALAPLLDDLSKDLDEWNQSGRAQEFATSIASLLSTTGSVFMKFIDFMTSYVHGPLDLALMGFVVVLTKFAADLALQRLAASGAAGGFIGVLATVVAGLILYANQLKETGNTKFMNDVTLAEQGASKDPVVMAKQRTLATATVLGSGSVADLAAYASQANDPVVKSQDRIVSDEYTGYRKFIEGDLLPRWNAVQRKHGQNEYTFDMFQSKFGNDFTGGVKLLTNLQQQYQAQAGLDDGDFGNAKDNATMSRLLAKANEWQDGAVQAGLQTALKDKALARIRQGGTQNLATESIAQFRAVVAKARAMGVALPKDYSIKDFQSDLAVETAAKKQGFGASSVSGRIASLDAAWKASKDGQVNGVVTPVPPEEKVKAGSKAWGVEHIAVDVSPWERRLASAQEALSTAQDFTAEMPGSTKANIVDKLEAEKRLLARRNAVIDAQLALDKHSIAPLAHTLGGTQVSGYASELSTINDIKRRAQAQFGGTIEQYSGAPRNIGSTGKPSLHNLGLALDMSGGDLQSKADWAIKQPGANAVIYNRRIWTQSTQRWLPYNVAGGDPHLDHVHLEGVRPGKSLSEEGPTDQQRNEWLKAQDENVKKFQEAYRKSYKERTKAQAEFRKAQIQHLKEYGGIDSEIYGGKAAAAYDAQMFSLDALDINTDASKNPYAALGVADTKYSANRVKLEADLRARAMAANQGTDTVYTLGAKGSLPKLDEGKLLKRIQGYKSSPDSENGRWYAEQLQKLNQAHALEQISLNHTISSNTIESDKRYQLQSIVSDNNAQGQALDLSHQYGSDRALMQIQQQNELYKSAIDVKQKAYGSTDPDFGDARRSQLAEQIATLQKLIDSNNQLALTIQRNTAVQETVANHTLQQTIAKFSGTDTGDSFSRYVDKFNLGEETKYGNMSPQDTVKAAYNKGLVTDDELSTISPATAKARLMNQDYVNAMPQARQQQTLSTVGNMEQAAALALIQRNGAKGMANAAAGAAGSPQEQLATSIKRLSSANKTYRNPDYYDPNDPNADENGMVQGGYNMNGVNGQWANVADVGASLATSYLNPHSYASQGSAIGGMIGTAIGGPFGTALGTIGGGLIGSLFGSSQPNPAEEAYKRRIENYLNSIDQSLRPVHDYFQNKVQTFSAESRYLSGRGLGFGDMVGAG